MNWKKIFVFAAVLFASEFVIGFVEGGIGIANPDSAQEQFLLSTSLSFLFASTIFCYMASRQTQRPFAHATLALIVMLVLSLAVALALHLMAGSYFHIVLVTVEWLTLIAALIVGTSLARLWRGRPGASAPDA